MNFKFNQILDEAYVIWNTLITIMNFIYLYKHWSQVSFEHISILILQHILSHVHAFLASNFLTPFVATAITLIEDCICWVITKWSHASWILQEDSFLTVL